MVPSASPEFMVLKTSLGYVFGEYQGEVPHNPNLILVQEFGFSSAGPYPKKAIIFRGTDQQAATIHEALEKSRKQSQILQEKALKAHQRREQKILIEALRAQSPENRRWLDGHDPGPLTCKPSNGKKDGDEIAYRENGIEYSFFAHRVLMVTKGLPPVFLMDLGPSSNPTNQAALFPALDRAVKHYGQQLARINLHVRSPNKRYILTHADGELAIAQWLKFTFDSDNRLVVIAHG